jgi:hypothetical protein
MSAILEKLFLVPDSNFTYPNVDQQSVMLFLRPLINNAFKFRCDGPDGV